MTIRGAVVAITLLIGVANCVEPHSVEIRAGALTSHTTLLADDFSTSLDSSKWFILDGAGPGITVAGGKLILENGPDHKNVVSTSRFSPSGGEVIARARIKLMGDYQKFGFNVNYALAPKVAFYFDTLEASYGGSADSVFALAFASPGGSGELPPILSVKAPVRWGEFHDFEVHWKPTNVSFAIDGVVIASTNVSFDEPLPVGLWNDRWLRMEFDSVEVVGGDRCSTDPSDSDGDGVADACDVCPIDPQDDADRDGFCGDRDNCPLVSNNQVDTDGDGLGDSCDDDNDGDGRLDSVDNCAGIFNPTQGDMDRDGAGDACDLDDDADGVIDSVDLCLSSRGGAVVDAVGCSVDDLCPCSQSWKNHGSYVSCVAREATRFVANSSLTTTNREGLVSAAARSECGD